MSTPEVLILDQRRVIHCITALWAAESNSPRQAQDDPQLTLTLKAQGYDILQTSEGWRAIDLARDNEPDLILMDIGLPDICGLDVTRLLKQDDQTKTIPIIAVTAFAMPEYEKRSLKSGCNAYITKPILIDKLLRTVESFCLLPRPYLVASDAEIANRGTWNTLTTQVSQTPRRETSRRAGKASNPALRD